MNQVVIGIPTFRRPTELRRLLASLMHEIDENVLVLVADNDCSADARQVVDEFAGQRGSVAYTEVRERGISAVRNALVERAGDHLPDWSWLIMLDDDGWVTPGWFRALMACGATHGAELIGGSIEGDLPPHASVFARNSIFARRDNHPSGVVEQLNHTQNIAISRRVLERLPQPLFRRELGLSGGEDYDFFRSARVAGLRQVWCREAVVVEPTPPDRLTTGSIFFRYYSTGATMALIDRTYDGGARTWFGAGKGFAGSVLRTGTGTVAHGRDGWAKGLLGVTHYVGRIAGLLGARTSRYSKPPASPASRNP